VGNAASFSGGNPSYFTRPAGHGLQAGARSFAFSLWVTLDAVVNEVILWCGNSGHTYTNDYYLHYISSSLTFYVPSAGVWRQASATTFGAWTAGVANHVYCEYDIDANLIGISINNGTLDQGLGPVTPNDMGHGFFLGYVNGFWFEGDLDEVAFWGGRVLTTAERSELYNDGSGIDYPG
jgi:hypothetical protein